MIKKILIQGINARYVHSNPALLYLKRYISDLNYQTIISESSINESPSEIVKSVAESSPDIAAISVYIWNSGIVKKILPELKRHLSSLTIVLGGPEVSYNPEVWMELHPEINFIISGGGEAAFRELALSGFTRSERILKVANPHFRDIPFPYDDAEMKRLAGKFIYYESSRGCPFKCSYCLSSRSDQNLQFRDIAQVESELEFFRHHKPALVKFVDRTFNSRKEHYRGVWDYIVKNFSGGSTRFHFEIYPDLLDPDDLKFLETVPRNLFQFEMGIQTVKGETLAAINRAGRREGWIDNIKFLAEKGNIHLHTDLIAGLPYESYSEFGVSFNTVHSLGAEHFQCGFLKVLPGTEMSGRSAEFGLGYSPAPPYEVEYTRWINSAEMRKLKNIAELLEIFHNSGRFAEIEKFLCGVFGSPFSFYESLSDLCDGDIPSELRKWEGAALLLAKAAEPKNINSILMTDYLRWDWCRSMKLHHYPEMLKSDFTAETKRKGYNHIIHFSEKGFIHFGGITFTQDELRRSIFFKPESVEFRKMKMYHEYALFLPDKRIIEFNID